MWATPGHTADSLSFLLDPDDGNAPMVLTGDTILGQGTTVVAYPDGDLADYLARRSLGCRNSGQQPCCLDTDRTPPPARRLRRIWRTGRSGLPQVSAALGALGPDATAEAIVEQVYADVDRALWPAAELSVRAQLAYLRDR